MELMFILNVIFFFISSSLHLHCRGAIFRVCLHFFASQETFLPSAFLLLKLSPPSHFCFRSFSAIAISPSEASSSASTATEACPATPFLLLKLVRHRHFCTKLRVRARARAQSPWICTLPESLASSALKVGTSLTIRTSPRNSVSFLITSPTKSVPRTLMLCLSAQIRIRCSSTLHHPRPARLRFACATNILWLLLAPDHHLPLRICSPPSLGLCSPCLIPRLLKSTALPMPFRIQNRSRRR